MACVPDGCCVPDDALKPSLSQEELDEYMMNCDTEVEGDSPMSGALRRRGRTHELGEFFTDSGPCSSEVSEESPMSKACKFRHVMSEIDKDDASPLASKLLLRKKQMRMTHPSPWKINFHPDDTD